MYAFKLNRAYQFTGQELMVVVDILNTNTGAVVKTVTLPWQSEEDLIERLNIQAQLLHYGFCWNGPLDDLRKVLKKGKMRMFKKTIPDNS